MGAGDVPEPVERLGGPLRVPGLEGAQALDLQPLPPRRGPRQRDPGHRRAAGVPVEADDRALARVDLPLVAVGGLLDLAALVALFHRGEHAAECVDFAEDVEDRALDLPLEGEEPRRPGKDVHRVLEDARLLEEDRLGVRREPDVFLGRRREGLVGAVAVAGIGSVQVREHQLDGGAGEVVLELGRDERAAARLRVELEHLGLRAGPVAVAHADRPDAPAGAAEHEVLDVEAAIQEEREPRAKAVHVQPAGAKQVGVGEAVAQRERRLLHGRGPRLRDMVAADAYGIPAGHVRDAPLHHVAQEPKGGVDREDDLVLRLHLLEHVGLDRAAQLRHAVGPQRRW